MDLSESVAVRNAPPDPVCAAVYWQGKYEAMRERALGLSLLLISIAPEDVVDVTALRDQMNVLFDDD